MISVGSAALATYIAAGKILKLAQNNDLMSPCEVYTIQSSMCPLWEAQSSSLAPTHNRRTGPDKAIHVVKLQAAYYLLCPLLCPSRCGQPSAVDRRAPDPCGEGL